MFGICYVIMTCAIAKIKKFGFLYKSIGKFGIWLKIVPKSHFGLDFLLKYERKWQLLQCTYKFPIWKQYLLTKWSKNFYAFYVFTVQRSMEWQPPYLLNLTIYPTTGEGAMYPVCASKWLKKDAPTVIKKCCPLATEKKFDKYWDYTS